MKLTPLDIQQQRFKVSLRGFDRVEVTDFLETVRRDYEALIEENQALRERLAESRQENAELRGREGELQTALATAKEMADKVVAEARQEAEDATKAAQQEAQEAVEAAQSKAQEMVEEAQRQAQIVTDGAAQEAERSLEGARANKARLEKEIAQLRTARQILHAEMRAMLERHLDQLSKEESTANEDDAQAVQEALANQAAEDAAKEAAKEAAQEAAAKRTSSVEDGDKPQGQSGEGEKKAAGDGLEADSTASDSKKPSKESVDASDDAPAVENAGEPESQPSDDGVSGDGEGGGEAALSISAEAKAAVLPSSKGASADRASNNKSDDGPTGASGMSFKEKLLAMSRPRQRFTSGGVLPPTQSKKEASSKDDSEAEAGSKTPEPAANAPSKEEPSQEEPEQSAKSPDEGVDGGDGGDNKAAKLPSIADAAWEDLDKALAEAEEADGDGLKGVDSMDSLLPISLPEPENPEDVEQIDLSLDLLP